MRTFGLAVLLALLCSCALPSDDGARVILERAARDGWWRATYVLDGLESELRFQRRAGFYREEVWEVVTPGWRLDTAPRLTPPWSSRYAPTARSPTPSPSRSPSEATEEPNQSKLPSSPVNPPWVSLIFWCDLTSPGVAAAVVANVRTIDRQRQAAPGIAC